MILSDADILDRLARRDLVVEPLDDVDQQVQPASVDLRLGERFLEFQRTNIPCIHPTGPTRSATTSRRRASERARSSSSTRATSCSGPPRSASDPAGPARDRARPVLARAARDRHPATGIVDPGYKGQITLELSNLGTAPVALTPRMRVSQLIFTELKSPAKRPYGVERGSKYQDQDGPQASRIGSDPEFHSDENQAAEHES